LAKEENEKTIEFLYAKPISRNQIVTGKLLACLTYIVLFDLLVHTATFISIEVVCQEDYSMAVFWSLALAAFLAHTSLASLGYLASAVMTKSKRALPLAMGLALATAKTLPCR